MCSPEERTAANKLPDYRGKHRASLSERPRHMEDQDVNECTGNTARE